MYGQSGLIQLARMGCLGDSPRLSHSEAVTHQVRIRARIDGEQFRSSGTFASIVVLRWRGGVLTDGSQRRRLLSCHGLG